MSVNPNAGKPAFRVPASRSSSKSVKDIIPGKILLDRMPSIPEMSWRRGLPPESALESPGVNRLD